MNKTFSYVLIIVITALIAGGSVYYWQNKTIQPITDTTNGVVKLVSVADCSHLDNTWTPFSNNETTLSFCYKKDWGESNLEETSISPQFLTGTTWFVTFSEAPHLKSVLRNSYPLISYSTPDYKNTGDREGQDFDWNSLDISNNNDEIAKLFSYADSVDIIKLDLNGNRAIKVKTELTEPFSEEFITPISYYVPNVTINNKPYNLQVMGGPEIESDLDTLIKTFNF